jgi:hypothetical protein
MRKGAGHKDSLNMRLSVSALLGVCLLVAPAHAAPASAIKDFAMPTQFGDGAPLIKVQAMTPAPGVQNPGGGQPQNNKRSGGSPQPGVQRQGGGQQQNRGGGGSGQQYNRGGGQHYGGGGYRGGDRHDRGGDDGAGVAAGVLGGLLLGAIIANESQRNDCARRPGYDPRSHTFVGSDRRRYRCP